MKTKKTIYFSVLALFIAAASFSIYMVLNEAKEFKESREKYTETVVFKNGVLDGESWLVPGAWHEKIEQADVFKNRSNRNYGSILNYSYIFVGAAGVFILLTLIIFMKSVFVWRYMSATLLFIAIAGLIIGISTPMMEMAVFNENLEIPVHLQKAYSDYIPDYMDFLNMEFTFEGRMYYFYQTKSIVGLIGILFAQGNLMVGIAILLFSVILPAIKLICSFLELTNDRAAKSKFVHFITNKLGKWSMADVFVVAMFLGYFSFANINPGVETQTDALFGLYCFFGFVVISLITTYFIEIAIKKEAAITEESQNSVDQSLEIND